jgi:hypothetical protein
MDYFAHPSATEQSASSTASAGTNNSQEILETSVISYSGVLLWDLRVVRKYPEPCQGQQMTLAGNAVLLPLKQVITVRIEWILLKIQCRA